MTAWTPPCGRKSVTGRTRARSRCWRARVRGFLESLCLTGSGFTGFWGVSQGLRVLSDVVF
jgi:hypothetical protein